MRRWRAIRPHTVTLHGSGRKPRIIGGAELAGLALESDLVDECHLFLNPVIVGGGKPAFRAALRRNLELLETRRFGTGVIHVRYRIRGGTP